MFIHALLLFLMHLIFALSSAGIDLLFSILAKEILEQMVKKCSLCLISYVSPPYVNFKLFDLVESVELLVVESFH